MNNEAQLLVYIDSELKKEIQKKAIDLNLSLKRLVSDALTHYLNRTQIDDNL